MSSQSAWSQTTKTIRIVVPYQPGGGNDILARLLGEQIGRAQGPAIVIENRPGGGSVIGTEAVACRARRQHFANAYGGPHNRPASAKAEL
jgi:tripartite-type tricarboxylate transporter receptor subunit TctC